MKRFPFAVALSAAMLLLPVGAASAQVASEDSVTGASAPNELGHFFIFDAHSGPSGENATGVVRFVVSPGSEAVFTVSCLGVDGTTATIGTTLGVVVHFYVEDNDGREADRFAIGGPSVVDCRVPAPPQDDRAWTISGGGLTVIDAQPFPTTKDQCKNGGWRNYGTTFKNQGQCVAFVERGPKG
jgi:hypothetical protein